MEDFASKVVSGIVVGVISALATVRISLHKFRSEKWWERKVDAYSKIIEALHNSKQFSEKHMHAVEQGKEVAEEADKALRSMSESANAEIARVVSIGSFLLSDAAMARLAQYKKDEAKAGEAEDWYSYLDSDWAATSTCLKDMIELAKADLRVKPLLRWPQTDKSP